MTDKKVMANAKVMFDSINGAYVDLEVPSTNRSGGIHKTITVESFAMALSTSIKEKPRKNIKFSIGKVPPNTYTLSLKTTARGQMNGIDAWFYVPGRKRQFRYTANDAGELTKGGKEYVAEIPYPNLVFHATAEGYSGGSLSSGSLYVYAYKGTYLCDDTRLYRYPFGNVHTNARVCMGGYSVQVYGLTDLYMYVNQFFLMGTNHDLYSASTNCSGMKQSDFIKMLEKEETFPLDKLADFDKPLTLKDVIGETEMKVSW